MNANPNVGAARELKEALPSSPVLAQPGKTLRSVLHISATDLGHLSENSNKVYWGVLGLYALVAGFLGLLISIARLPASPLVIAGYAVVFVGIGWTQFSLWHAQHEGIHNNFGKPHNEFLAGLLTTYPIGFTMNYRYIHLDHHRHFGDPQLDPDYIYYADFPKTKGAFLLRMLYYVSGIPAITQFFTQRASQRHRHPYREYMKLVIVQLGILGLFTWLLGPGWYLLFWILPVMTIGKLCSTSRVLCEHGSPDKPEGVYRTILGNSFEVGTLGYMNFNYHAEHHAYSSIPFGALARAFQKLYPEYQGTAAVEFFRGGYLKLLWGWFRHLPLRAA